MLTITNDCILFKTSLLNFYHLIGYWSGCVELLGITIKVLSICKTGF